MEAILRLLTRGIKKTIPSRYHRRLRSFTEKALLSIKYYGLSHYCPICRAHVRQFLPFGRVVKRPDAMCPVCGSLERHRLIWLYFLQKMNLLSGKRIKLLHIAPEEMFAEILSKAANIEYLTADIQSSLAMVRMDITNIQYPDDTFDAIYCSHVLEHVADDQRAMRELCRVLKLGGWGILQVPIEDRETTFEDWSVQSPEEREKIFGQHDHVRIYGRDYKDRLESAGFSVTVDPFVREFSDREVRRLGLQRDEEVFFCQKLRA